ncbi:hypothetical protein SAMN02910377_01925 [Pseudobutyrivibrio ruminis]|uniref:DUF5050 domain-containing protein n=1 Tax=Pseudobutyrivibrio ruminis TaxID=46206 RepID=A0A1H7K8K3_9FIRM|nr:hypothetical protein [Pseudobutyrivibrio ruminis]SEK82884.1 hypothetical protein SAMN02910377_01925 [Pseudobutyrivibrio ruminis]
MLDGIEWICSDQVIDNHHLYFGSNGALYRVDMDTWRTAYIPNIKNIEWLKKRGVGHIVLLNKLLILINWSPMSIAGYDIEKNIITELYEEQNSTANIFKIEKWNDRIFIFRREKDEMIILSKNGLCEVRPFLAGIDKTNMHSCRKGGDVFFFPISGKQYYKYNIENNKLTEGTLLFELSECQDVAFFEGAIYFLEKKYIKIWDEKSNIKNIEIQYNKNESIEGIIIPLKDKMFVLPRHIKDIFTINYNGEINKYTEYPVDFHITQSDDWLKIGTQYISYEQEDGIYYFPRRSTNYMLTIDSNSQHIKWIELLEPSEEEKVLHLIETEKIIYEKENYLPLFIKTI